MKRYNLLNNALGWVVFAIAAFTYCSTVEPSASFWDCPEFISTAYKLEVGHSPGAPFFMLTGNFFSQFTSDPTKVAYMVNIMSALLSALCILFLFWTITHLTRKVLCTDGQPRTAGELVTVLSAGLVGALAYAWSDTFWFSAEEGEVYAYSSMFTALVFWLALKWEDHADEPHSDRWLVLIFYLTGISIGVHLLNLLCLPAIALIYYFRKTPQPRARQALGAVVIGCLLVGAVLYGVVPGIVKVGGWFELFFVNVLGLGFNSGMVIYVLLLVGVVLCAIWSTTRANRTLSNTLYLVSVALLGIPFLGSGVWSIVIGLVILGALWFLLGLRSRKTKEYVLRKRVLNTSLLCMLMLMIGYSSYAVIVIRSVANPPMDQNSPEDIFSLGSYLSRDQYGDTPLFYGPAYSSMIKYDESGYPVYKNKTTHHRREKKDATEPDRYEDVEEISGIEYNSATKMLFPRMYSRAHQGAYEEMLGDNLKTRSVDVELPNGYVQTVEMPTQMTNLRFFLNYQVNYMYWRYFGWNFVGRQNGYQGSYRDKGNCVTGIAPIDKIFYGDTAKMPDELKNDKGHNVFYGLPLLLGLLGLFWQLFRKPDGSKQCLVVMLLFFMTGLAIVLYLNQTPNQPRERDYAYAGSFYAFAIWIGLGVAAIATWLQSLAARLRCATPQLGLPVAALASLLCLLVPLQMVSQTWDDHDRSDRYACRDFGLNYLNTMPEKLADGTPAMPIIFTNGDNDTFPLWYNQETEGQRTDARVCNLSYLNTEWYTDQMKRDAYDSKALPIAWKRIEYVDDGHHSTFPFRDEKKQLDALKAKNPNVDPYDLRYIMDHYVRNADGHGYFPTDSVVIYVNKENILNQGMQVPGDSSGTGAAIPEKISIDLSWASRRGYMDRNQAMIYEMLARNEWKRPMYMSVTLGQENYAGLQDYLCLEGLAYRITPFKRGMSTMDTDKMYKNLTTRFRYGNVNHPGIFLDETNLRMCQTHRRMFAMLAQRLLQEGQKAKALSALRYGEKMLPAATVPYEYQDDDLAGLWLQAGDKQGAAKVAKEVARQNWQFFDWANTLSNTTGYEMQAARNIRSLFACTDILKEAGAKEARLYENRFNQAVNTPLGSAGYELLMRSQQGASAPAAPSPAGSLPGAVNPAALLSGGAQSEEDDWEE